MYILNKTDNINYKLLNESIYLNIINNDNFIFLVFDYDGNCVINYRIEYKFSFYVNEQINFDYNIEINIV